MEHQRVLSSLTEFRGQDRSVDLATKIPTARAGKRPISAKTLCRALIPLDVLLILATALLSYEVVFAYETALGRYAAIAAFGALLAVNLFHLAGIYAPRSLREPWLTAGRLTLGWTVAVAMIVTVGVFSGIAADYSRPWTLQWFLLGLAALLGLRGVVFAQAARWMAEGRLGRRVAILGDPALAARLAHHFTADPGQGINVAGIFSDREQDEGLRQVAGFNLGGGSDALIDRLRAEPIDAVILAPAEHDEAHLRELCRKLSEAPVNVWLCPGSEALSLLGARVSHFAGIPALGVMEQPIGSWRRVVKEIEDRTIAALITLMISPLLLGIALAIKLDSPGPLLFRQRRRGYNNQPIEVLKFRTMAVDKTDSDGDRLTERNDPRITRVGAFLRKWSLDELPQFFNVLRGEMSIVGPRPHALKAKAGGQYYFDAVPFYDARHRVKPGITGLAQIHGWRGPTETVTQIRKRVEYDIYYIEHWSLWLDIKIILLTVFKGFKSENAF